METEYKGIVLIADDDHNQLSFLETVFSRFYPFYLVESFSEGASLYERLKKGSGGLALVLTDNNMPRMNGVDVVRMYSNQIDFVNVPFVLQSGLLELSDALNSGAKDFLQKPHELSELMRVLDKYLVRE